MEVSVIIPAYQAARFVRDAVRSALVQPEVKEILMIEDGSRDETLRTCEELMRAHERVHLLQHPNGENRGVSASRNLGLQNATYPFIAFLDADDEYVPGRFERTRKIFAQFPDANGVYETIGVKYHDPGLKALHIERTWGENTGIRRTLQPERLFAALASGRHGHISLDGFTIKKSAIDDQLMFDTALAQCQDLDWFLRLSRSRRLYPGDYHRVVALRGVHANNHVFRWEEAARYRALCMSKCIRNDFYGSRDVMANVYLVGRMFRNRIYRKPQNRLPFYGIFAIAMLSFGYLITHPRTAVRMLTPPKNVQQ